MKLRSEILLGALVLLVGVEAFKLFSTPYLLNNVRYWVIDIPICLIGNSMFEYGLQKLRGVREVRVWCSDSGNGFMSTVDLKQGGKVLFTNIDRRGFVDTKSMSFAVSKTRDFPRADNLSPNNKWFRSLEWTGGTFERYMILPFKLHNYQEVIDHYDEIMKIVGNPKDYMNDVYRSDGIDYYYVSRE